MSVPRFLVYTTAGSALWNMALIAAGYLLESQYDRVVDYLNPVTNLILGVIAVAYDAVIQPVLNSRDIGMGENAVALRLYLAIAVVDDRQLVHLDPALTVLRIHAEHGSPVLADSEVVIWKISAQAP